MTSKKEKDKDLDCRDSAKDAESRNDGVDVGDAALGVPPTEEDADTKYLRLAADFQNYKRRMEKERFERYSEGKKDFAEDLLAVVDNFDRALGHIEGMDMILAQFIDVLAKNGVSEIKALGEDFDPNFHHAVVMEPSAEYDSQKISEVMQKGYMIGEKVIRPAMVKVAE